MKQMYEINRMLNKSNIYAFIAAVHKLVSEKVEKYRKLCAYT